MKKEEEEFYNDKQKVEICMHSNKIVTLVNVFRHTITIYIYINTHLKKKVKTRSDEEKKPFKWHNN